MNNKILIFDAIGGLSDQKKNIISAIQFCNKHNFKFTFNQSTCRPKENPTIYRKYDIDNLFDINVFSIYDNFINYNEIKNKINDNNTYDFFTDKINGKLYNSDYKNYLNDIKNNICNIISNCEKEYIIIGGGCWSYIDYKYNEYMIHDFIQPSKKIMDKYNEINEKINCSEYNFIHYRYEKDWENFLLKQNKPFICPLLDTLIKNIPFKKKMPIYICTSCIETLYDKKLMLKPLSEYSNILYKNEKDFADFNYDECGYVDYLIGKNAEEIYGFSHSGFSKNLNNLKKTNNYYDTV
uniref:Polysaccharide pyruvyl transferase domain-containing protein n=1 Tax=viral metagenome TaxID=1070528 RepID=A0A6C0I029_9ZZZZ